MLKCKSIFSAILAIGILATGAIPVYADGNDYVEGRLASCGDVGGYSTSFISGSYKCVKSETYSENDAYKIKADMQAVNRNTGATLASGSDEVSYYTYASVMKTVDANTSVTVYGAHQVWGTSSDYWGKYTTVYD